MGSVIGQAMLKLCYGQSQCHMLLQYVCDFEKIFSKKIKTTKAAVASYNLH